MSESDRGEQGRRGDPGVAGRQGESGTTGREGVAGQRGVTGQAGPTGDTGIEGPAGQRGRQGEQPKLRWAPAIGFLLLVVLIVGLAVQAFVAAQQGADHERRIQRLEQDVGQLRE